jgi:hypothetical protein
MRLVTFVLRSSYYCTVKYWSPLISRLENVDCGVLLNQTVPTFITVRMIKNIVVEGIFLRENLSFTYSLTFGLDFGTFGYSSYSALGSTTTGSTTTGSTTIGVSLFSSVIDSIINSLYYNFYIT